jgi:hypothetical protein
MPSKKDSIFKPKSEAGKGDKPRNMSAKYFDNFDQIEWKSKKGNEDKSKK